MNYGSPKAEAIAKKARERWADKAWREKNADTFGRRGMAVTVNAITYPSLSAAIHATGMTEVQLRDAGAKREFGPGKEVTVNGFTYPSRKAAQHALGVSRTALFRLLEVNHA